MQRVLTAPRGLEAVEDQVQAVLEPIAVAVAGARLQDVVGGQLAEVRVLLDYDERAPALWHP